VLGTFVTQRAQRTWGYPRIDEKVVGGGSPTSRRVTMLQL